MEESQRFPKSLSGTRKRSGTPEFFVLERTEIEADDSDDNPEENRILADMEA